MAIQKGVDMLCDEALGLLPRQADEGLRARELVDRSPFDRE